MNPICPKSRRAGVWIAIAVAVATAVSAGHKTQAPVPEMPADRR